jgi:hypothetical protein
MGVEGLLPLKLKIDNMKRRLLNESKEARNLDKENSIRNEYVLSHVKRLAHEHGGIEGLIEYGGNLHILSDDYPPCVVVICEDFFYVPQLCNIIANGYNFNFELLGSCDIKELEMYM